jgi:hypothetical protein
LLSILIHSGSAHAGHYFCYVRDSFVHPPDAPSSSEQSSSASSASPDSSGWLLFNDSTVTSITQEQLDIILGADSPPPSGPSTDKKTATQPVVPSANNAYMLIYRLISPVNLHDLSALDHLPADLLSEIQRENAIYQEQKAKYDYERAFLHLALSPALVGVSQSLDTKPAIGGGTSASQSEIAKNKVFRVHETATLEQLTSMVYHDYFPQETGDASGSPPRREDVRLRVYDSIKGTLLSPMVLFAKSVLEQHELYVPTDDKPLTVDESTLAVGQHEMEEATTLVSLPETTLKRIFHLEVKASHEKFSLLGSGQGIDLTLEVCLYRRPSTSAASEGESKPGDGQQALSPPYPIQIRSNQTLEQMLDAISGLLSVQETSHWPSIVSHEDLVSHVVLVKHDISSGLARVLYPPNPARTTSAVKLSSALSMFLTNNDRLYVDYDPSFQQQQQVTQSTAQTSLPSPQVTNLMEYFEGIYNEITLQYTHLTTEDTPSPSSSSLLPRRELCVDRRSSLASVKQKIASLLNLSLDSFILLRGVDGDKDPQLEMKNLNLSIAESGLQDGGYLRLSYGAPLAHGDYRINLLQKTLTPLDQQIAQGGYQPQHQSFVSLGTTIIHADQTIASFKGWCQETFFSAQASAPSAIRVQFTQLVDGPSIPLAAAEEGEQGVGAVMTYKPVYVLSDAKTFKECLGNNLKDGITLTLTTEVQEATYDDTKDLLIALWEWVTVWPRDETNEATMLLYHDEVIVPQEMTFQQLKQTLWTNHIAASSDQQQSGNEDAQGKVEQQKGKKDIFFAKPFTWQLKDLKNLPTLKWKNQPEEMTATLSGPPYRLRNTPQSGSAALLFHHCSQEEFEENIRMSEGNQASDGGTGARPERPLESSFRLYSMTEQTARKREEEKADTERRQLIEEKLRLIQTNLVQNAK